MYIRNILESCLILKNPHEHRLKISFITFFQIFIFASLRLFLILKTFFILYESQKCNAKTYTMNANIFHFKYDFESFLKTTGNT